MYLILEFHLFFHSRDNLNYMHGYEVHGAIYFNSYIQHSLKRANMVT